MESLLILILSFIILLRTLSFYSIFIDILVPIRNICEFLMILFLSLFLNIFVLFLMLFNRFIYSIYSLLLYFCLIVCFIFDVICFLLHGLFHCFNINLFWVCLYCCNYLHFNFLIIMAFCLYLHCFNNNHYDFLTFIFLSNLFYEDYFMNLFLLFVILNSLYFLLSSSILIYLNINHSILITAYRSLNYFNFIFHSFHYNYFLNIIILFLNFYPLSMNYYFSNGYFKFGIYFHSYNIC